MHTAHFFQLLRAGLLGKPADSRLFLDLGLTQWEALFRLSTEQAIAGVIWDGILSLPEELHPPKTLWFQWLGMVLKIEKGNEQLNALLPEILEIASDAGMKMQVHVVPVALLKGQGTAALYPEPLHRTPGDVDIYAGKKYTLLEKYLPTRGFKCIGHSTKHSEYLYKEAMVENHRYVALFFCPRLAWRLRSLVRQWFPHSLSLRRVANQDVLVAPPWFEALFGVIHFRTHLHLEGVGWRHLCDWWLLRQELWREDAESLHQHSRYTQGLRSLGLVRMEAVMEEVFQKLVLRNEPEELLSPMASEVYAEMMQGGNFGHHAADAHDHTFSHQSGFWKALWNLWTHDVRRSIRFFRLFPEEAILSPIFRAGGYLRRRGK